MSRDISIQELEQIYTTASELTGEARLLFLDAACAGKPQTRRQIDEMLAADQTFLSESIVHRSLRSEPTAIGRWRILRKLGEGGLGLVYHAETAEDGVTLQAAIKILRPGFEEGFFRGRFQQERQILANLSHPGIARFIDCGADSSGRSFLAMEFVNGQPLPSFLDSNPIATPQKIAIFDSIAHAVQYLHSRLIVHGDIKPGNVMVTPDGATKLLDFGTARLLEAGPTTELTRLLLTPHYASPEQKRGEGPSVPSDIYSLGRLLQELLGPEQDPDLQAIVRRCLAEEPDARYPSAGSLIEDIHRWRTGYPVHARRQTLLYSIARFTRRHWHAAALTFLLLVSLAAGWWNSKRNADQTRLMADEARRHAAESDTQRRRAESATANATSNATRYRNLLGQVLHDDEFTDTSVVSNGGPTEIVYRVLIAQLEKETNPSALGDLAVSWRRLGAALCHKGDYRRGLGAMAKAVHYATLWRTRHPSPESRTLAIVTHLVFMKLHRAHFDHPQAVRHAAAALKLFSLLPPAEQARLNTRHILQLGRVLAAESHAGSPTELPLLLDASSHTTRGLTGIATRTMALTRIISIYATRGDKQKLAPFCRQSEELLIWDASVRRACGLPVRNLSTPNIRLMLVTLNDDNQGHHWKLFLGNLYLNLAQQIFPFGFQTEAIHAFRLAQLALRETSAADPGGPGVQDLRRRIESARALAAAARR